VIVQFPVYSRVVCDTLICIFLRAFKYYEHEKTEREKCGAGNGNFSDTVR